MVENFTGLVVCAPRHSAYPCQWPFFPQTVQLVFFLCSAMDYRFPFLPPLPPVAVLAPPLFPFSPNGQMFELLRGDAQDVVQLLREVRGAVIVVLLLALLVDVVAVVFVIRLVSFVIDRLLVLGDLHRSPRPLVVRVLRQGAPVLVVEGPRWHSVPCRTLQFASCATVVYRRSRSFVGVDHHHALLDVVELVGAFGSNDHVADALVRQEALGQKPMSPRLGLGGRPHVDVAIQQLGLDAQVPVDVDPDALAALPFDVLVRVQVRGLAVDVSLLVCGSQPSSWLMSSKLMNSTSLNASPLIASWRSKAASERGLYDRMRSLHTSTFRNHRLKTAGSRLALSGAYSGAEGTCPPRQRLL